MVLIIWINCRLVYNLSDDLCVVMMFPKLYNIIIGNGNDGQNYTKKNPTCYELEISCKGLIRAGIGQNAQQVLHS